MQKQSLPLCFLFVACVVESPLYVRCAIAQPTSSEVRRMRESAPVIVNDAQFVVVAQTDWKPGKPRIDFPMIATIEIQLRITNLNKAEVGFATNRTTSSRPGQGHTSLRMLFVLLGMDDHHVADRALLKSS